MFSLAALTPLLSGLTILALLFVLSVVLLIVGSTIKFGCSFVMADLAKQRLRKRDLPLTFTEIVPAVTQDHPSALSSAIYRAAFANPTFSEESKEALAHLNSSQVLNFADKRTATQVSESLVELRPLVSLPAPSFTDPSSMYLAPAYRLKMKRLGEILLLHSLFCARTKNFDEAVFDLSLFSTVSAHLAEMPTPTANFIANALFRGQFAVMKLMGKSMSKGEMTVHQALTAAESLIKIPSPWPNMPIMCTHHLDMIENLPESAESMKLQVLETERSRIARLKSASKTDTKLAYWKAVRVYEALTSVDTSTMNGSEMLTHVDKCMRIAPSNWGDVHEIYRFEDPDPTTVIRSYLTFETLRKMYVTALRIASAMVDHSSWTLPIQIDNSDVDPYSGERFSIKTTARSVRVVAECPDFLGLVGPQNTRMILKLDVFESLNGS